MQFEIAEEHRQLMVRGLAVQSLTDPGLKDAGRNAAKDLGAVEMFEQFIDAIGDCYSPRLKP